MVFSTSARPPPATPGTAPKSSSTRMLRSVTALVALCAKKAGQVTNKLKLNPSHDQLGHPSPRSPLTRPKKMLKTISQSAMTLVRKKRTGRRDEPAEEEEDEKEEWGHGGVWQRGILMGDKCQPLDFPGAIYYDSNGNKMNEPPLRSPRASPLPGNLFRKPEAFNVPKQ